MNKKEFKEMQDKLIDEVIDEVISERD